MPIQRRIFCVIIVIAWWCEYASACPDLSGTYFCPPRGTQAAMTLIVTNRPLANGAMQYQFRYIRDRETNLEVTASQQGIKREDGTLSTCTEREMITRGTANFINADGNYEASNNGKTQIVCSRVNK